MRVVSSFGISFFFCLSSQANGTTLAEAIKQAWNQSSQVKNQQRLYEISSGDRWRRFVPNEPTFNFTSTDSGVGETYGIQEAFAFPGKTFALTQVDSAKENSQRAELQAKKYEVAKLTAQTYVDCAGTLATIEAQKTNINDVETLARSLKARYEAGVATQAENIGTELQLRQMRADLISALDKSQVTCLKLEKLLQSQNDHAHYDLPDDLDSSIIQELGGLNADEARSQSAIQVAEASASTAVWSQLPDITLSAAQNHYYYLPGSPSNQPFTMTYGLSVTIPLLFPFHETVEAERARSQAAVDRNVAEVQLLNAKSDHRDASKEYQRSKARLHELRTKDLILGQALVDSTFSAYKSGKLGFAELVLARKTMSDLRSQEIQLRSSVVMSHLGCLNACEGTSP